MSDELVAPATGETPLKCPLLLLFQETKFSMRPVTPTAHAARLDDASAPIAPENGFIAGKSRGLLSLRPALAAGTIPDFIVVRLFDWRVRRAEALALCAHRFGNAPVAVRSDAHEEDGHHASRAGAYLSLLDVSPGALPDALDAVAARLPGHPGDQIIVQMMVRGISYAGVASTHRVSDGAPWYCVDVAPLDSAAVTSGRASGRQTAVARATVDDEEAVCGLGPTQPAWHALGLLRQVEALCGALPLEIEFALGVSEEGDGACQAYLLQVRPLATSRGWSRQHTQAARMVPPLDMLETPDVEPAVAGSRTLLSLMSDWNPAELLGAHPRPLALSLFETLIGRGAWWRARATLGYSRAPDPHVDLLRVVCGRPMVDVRRSANSFMPEGMDRRAAGRLVDAWTARLRAEPQLHDKVEFAVFRTVRDFTYDSPIEQEAHQVLGRDDWQLWEGALGQLTRRLTAVGAASPLGMCAASVDAVSRMRSDGRPWTELLETARQGSFAFAIAARLAFAGDAQLRSAMVRGALSAERVAALKQAGRSMPTAWPLAGASHGHLRPGTFDVTQPTWADCAYRPEGAASASSRVAFSPRAGESSALESLLREAGLDIEPDAWLAFVQESRALREWAKYVFSRHLSGAMDQIAAEAAACGVDRETLSWLTLEQWAHGCALDAPRRRNQLEAAAMLARQRHSEEGAVIVAPLLARPQDRWVADSLGVLPNFVGNHQVEGPVRLLGDNRPRGGDVSLRGTIVAVRQADPGFDWLFDCGISGLVTCWGGANSHMAIRCAELGVAAAIGCGEGLFAEAERAERARIDPPVGALWLS